LRSDLLLLQDILDAIDTVHHYLPPDRARFDGDPPLQSHILRQVQIIGEAAWRLSKAVKDQNPQVPWKQISGMRHVVVHDYFRVDWDTVFTTARDDLPPLRRQMEAIFGSLPPPSIP
jgi:uncharacterized protein with HEPN domain